MMRTRALTILVVAGVLLAACGDDDGDTAATTTTAASATTTTEPAAAVDVNLYFLDRDVHVATAGRSVAGDDVPRAALAALLEGPDDLEADLGWGSAIPVGTELLGLEVADGVATVDLTAAFESGGGSASMLGRVAQVVFTLTQFPGIERVRFAIDGDAVDTIGNEGVEVGGAGVDRRAFDAVLPMIFVESPTPGQEVASPVTIRGYNNTYEGTVNYTITDPEGLILEEGFATGEGGSGRWGPFEATAAFTTTRSGLGEVIVYEVSPEDGSHQHVVEIPVAMSAD
jgi:hypothetical protein